MSNMVIKNKEKFKNLFRAYSCVIPSEINNM